MKEKNKNRDIVSIVFGAIGILIALTYFVLLIGGLDVRGGQRLL